MAKMNGKQIMAEMQRLYDEKNKAIEECMPIIRMFEKLAKSLGGSWTFNCGMQTAMKLGIVEEYKTYMFYKKKLNNATDAYKEYTKKHYHIYDKWILIREEVA